MIEVIAFDADDTLWHNESNFQSTEKQFAEMLAAWHPEEWVRKRLLETELRNLAHFGYGVKGFILSMLESALDLTEGRITGQEIRRILDWGHEMLRAPVELLEGVDETVRGLAATHRLVLLTKGDLFDQESKLARSGLGDLFSSVEIVSEKNAQTYRTVIGKANVEATQFVMVGNSLKSDVLPALEAGAMAVHIPYHMTWAHEHVPAELVGDREFGQLRSIAELPEWIAARQRGGMLSP